MIIDPIFAFVMVNHGEPSDAAKFREEYYTESKPAPAPKSRTGVSRAAENLLRATNTLRAARFTRLV